MELVTMMITRGEAIVVSLERRRSETWGMELRWHDDFGRLTVTALHNDSPILEWNRSQVESNWISVGDDIIAVDGILFKPERMLKELEKVRKVDLVVCPMHREVQVAATQRQKALLCQESVDELPDCLTMHSDSTKCAICLSDISDGGPAVQLPCQHYFHRQCVTKWLTECEAACPVCKQSAESSFVPQERVDIQTVRPCAQPRLLCDGIRDRLVRSRRLLPNPLGNGATA